MYVYSIEICGKLDKSNTQLRSRCVIFRLRFISSTQTSSKTETVF